MKEQQCRKSISKEAEAL